MPKNCGCSWATSTLKDSAWRQNSAYGMYVREIPSEHTVGGEI